VTFGRTEVSNQWTLCLLKEGLIKVICQVGRIAYVLSIALSFGLTLSRLLTIPALRASKSSFRRTWYY